MKKAIYIVLSIGCWAFSMTGCKYVREHQTNGLAAEVNGQKLYETEVISVVGKLTGEDSIRVRNEYIHQWAINILMQDKANEYTTPAIEQLVNDYRRSLCMYEYEKEMIEKQMSKYIQDSVIQQFYDTHLDRLILQDDIFKGLLLITPNDAPNQEALMHSLKQLQDDDLQFLEKYAYQNALGYELFLDEWKTASQLLLRMPFERNTLVSELKNKQQIILQDSLNKYILQVTDKCLQGHQMPFDYAQREIKELILNQRQQDFLKREREHLYKDGVRSKKVKIYE